MPTWRSWGSHPASTTARLASRSAPMALASSSIMGMFLSSRIPRPTATSTADCVMSTSPTAASTYSRNLFTVISVVTGLSVLTLVRLAAIAGGHGGLAHGDYVCVRVLELDPAVDLAAVVLAGRHRLASLHRDGDDVGAEGEIELDRERRGEVHALAGVADEHESGLLGLDQLHERGLVSRRVVVLEHRVINVDDLVGKRRALISKVVNYASEEHSRNR